VLANKVSVHGMVFDKDDFTIAVENFKECSFNFDIAGLAQEIVQHEVIIMVHAVQA